MTDEFNEVGWWGDCTNTFHEERKQLVYAPRMGLLLDWEGGHPPTIDMHGRSVGDIGGGPVSLLLKCVNLGYSVVVDPGEYPDWTIARYTAKGIDYLQKRGEDVVGTDSVDEVWIYNVLQHVDDPQRVIERAWSAARTCVRIFEWINVPAYPGHPQSLSEERLDYWLGQNGMVSEVADHGAIGTAYHGVFYG